MLPVARRMTNHLSCRVCVKCIADTAIGQVVVDMVMLCAKGALLVAYV